MNFLTVTRNQPCAPFFGFHGMLTHPWKTLPIALASIMLAGSYFWSPYTYNRLPIECKEIRDGREICFIRLNYEWENLNQVWKSLTPIEIQKFKDYFGDLLPMDQRLKDHLFLKPSELINQVAKRIGSSDLGEFSITDFHDHLEGMSVSVDNQVKIGKEIAYALNGWSHTLSPQEILGGFAHEVGHRIAKYQERQCRGALALQGIPVESLEDAKEFLLVIHKGSEEFLTRQSAKRLYASFINNEEIAVLSKNERRGNMFTMMDLFILLACNRNPEYLRNEERVADLYTMRDPVLGRGLRDFFLRRLDRCKNIESYPCPDDDIYYMKSHPPTSERIRYLTDALCDAYPKENSDICSNYRPNATTTTCPSFLT
jgi:hypothetical protein